MANEEWRTIKGFEKYEVSNYGRVRSKDRVVIRNDGHKLTLKGKLLKPITDHKGYVKVSIYNSNGIKISHVHRLVAIACIENPNMLPQVNHKDGNHANNSVYNLEWCTSEYNHRHALENNLYKVEEDSPRAKLTKEQVISIYKDYQHTMLIDSKTNITKEKLPTTEISIDEYLSNASTITYKFNSANQTYYFESSIISNS